MAVNAPLMGRLFESREEDAGLAQVAIVSYAMWERRLERDPDIVGKAIVLDGTPYQVIGVMGPGFHFPDPDTEFWTPYIWPANAQPVVVGQIVETATFESASREIDTLLRAARRQRSNGVDAGPRRGSPGPPPPAPPPPPGPPRDGRANAGAPPPPSGPTSSRGLSPAVEPRFVVVSLLDNIIADVRTPMTIVSCGVAFVFLIACVNVAGLLSARGLAREREIWLRLALGASRGRVIRLMMTESLLLTVAGGGVGVWLSMLGVRWIRTIGDVLPRTDEIQVDAATLLAAVGLTLASGLACGLAPALWQSGADARRALAQRPSTTARGLRVLRRGRAHAALLVVQISLAVVLLLGGGLLIRSFLKLSSVDPGYAATQVLTFQVALPPGESALAFATELNARLQVLPGVKASGYADHLPLARSSLGHVHLTTQPQPSPSSSAPPPPPPPGVGGTLDYPTAHLVSPDFLTAMGVRVIEGRGLSDTDRTSQPRPLLINSLLARSGYLGEHPVGKTVSGGSVAWTVVGVVEDFRETALASPPGAEIFVDIDNLGTRDALFGSSSPSFAVRTEGSPMALIPAIRDAVRAVNPHTSPDRIATMDDIVSHSILKPRFYASTLGLFAAIAGVLAIAGIYAGIASAVGRRTREIGIRVALGASRFQVLWTVAGDMLVLAAIGTAGGITVGLWLTRFLRQMLYDLTPLDPVVFVAIPLLFGFTALSAAIVSARPAFSIAPLIALRHE
jgi:predicted permease